MKRINAVVLVGRLTAPRRLEMALSEAETCVFALLVSDHRLYGGHHGVLFVGEHAAEVLDYWELTAAASRSRSRAGCAPAPARTATCPPASWSWSGRPASPLMPYMRRSNAARRNG